MVAQSALAEWLLVSASVEKRRLFIPAAALMSRGLATLDRVERAECLLVPPPLLVRSVILVSGATPPGPRGDSEHHPERVVQSHVSLSFVRVDIQPGETCQTM